MSSTIEPSDAPVEVVESPSQTIQETNNEDTNGNKETAPTANSDSETTPGASLTLPISRIKRIVKLDPEHISSTESANYILGAATELFIMNLTEKAIFNAKTNKRKKIQYGDFNQVVTSNENLSFLKDIVPKTAPLKELLDKKIVKLNTSNESSTTTTTTGAVVGSGTGTGSAADDTLEENVEEGATAIVKDTPTDTATTTTTPTTSRKGQQKLDFFRKITNPANPDTSVTPSEVIDSNKEGNNEKEDVIMID
ncbi:hypothetical protein CANARDRAFT_228623 [[Candida] arabinofermentans NRRL YB-2248]|uniref:Transcription factor CBF/NF-Y/archaeal histone domain-containing protein n=1 Tax=[Candida] arabinofermentans NRRL YB-2248 TaxID=983967 RepID=A0A1E4T8I0_9ASCO|nr:hypothetical protein CANARDRAFT_228623 [[Candida] arabinofermentans NRRL YB-2248]